MDPNQALKEWRAKNNRRAHAAALRGWIQSGGFEPDWTQQERALILFGRKRKQTKGSYVQRKTPAKNPRRHIPKTTRGRKPAKSNKFVCTAFDRNGKIVARRTYTGISKEMAEMRAARMVKGKIAQVVLEY